MKSWQFKHINKGLAILNLLETSKNQAWYRSFWLLHVVYSKVVFFFMDADIFRSLKTSSMKRFMLSSTIRTKGSIIGCYAWEFFIKSVCSLKMCLSHGCLNFTSAVCYYRFALLIGYIFFHIFAVNFFQIITLERLLRNRPVVS